MTNSKQTTTKKEKRKKRIKQVAAGVVAAAGIACTALVSAPNGIQVTDSTKPSTSTSVNNEDVTESEPEVVESTIDSGSDYDADNYIDYTLSDYKGDNQDVSTPNNTKPENSTDNSEINYTIEIAYEFSQSNEFSKTITLTIPDELSIDVVDMMFKDTLVVSGIMPIENSFTSIPLIFDNFDNITFKLHRSGEIVGDAKFIDDKLMTNVKAVK